MRLVPLPCSSADSEATVEGFVTPHTAAAFTRGGGGGGGGAGGSGAPPPHRRLQGRRKKNYSLADGSKRGKNPPEFDRPGGLALC